MGVVSTVAPPAPIQSSAAARTDGEEHWPAQRVASFLVRILIVLVPLQISVVVGLGLAQLLPRPRDRHRLRWAALLHDVGKLKVPADLLNGTGNLNEGQWEKIKRHPMDGARLIAPMWDFLGPWAQTIEQHHERHDGTGYPRGLA